MNEQPSKPARKPRLMDVGERIAAYGRPAEIVAGKLVPDPAWERANIVLQRVPWFQDGVIDRYIRVHKAAATQFKALFEAWLAAGLLDRLLTYNGAYNCRMKRGYEQSMQYKDMSTHAFGAAIDLNSVWNPLGKAPAPLNTRGSMLELVPLMREHGFVWGGDFHRIDAMHAEVGVLDNSPVAN
jgi:D-alanyl-D-alanine carboxypeptidase